MAHKLAQGASDLFLAPFGVLHLKSRRFELPHFFHELQADLEPPCGRQPA